MIPKKIPTSTAAFLCKDCGEIRRSYILDTTYECSRCHSLFRKSESINHQCPYCKLFSNWIEKHVCEACDKGTEIEEVKACQCPICNEFINLDDSTYLEHLESAHSDELFENLLDYYFTGFYKGQKIEFLTKTESENNKIVLGLVTEIEYSPRDQAWNIKVINTEGYYTWSGTPEAFHNGIDKAKSTSP